MSASIQLAGIFVYTKLMRILNPFRRLQWKLTLTYTLVSGGLVILLVGSLLVGLIQFLRSDAFLDIFQAIPNFLSSEIVTHLETTDSDFAEIENWLNDSVNGDVLTIGSDNNFTLDYSGVDSVSVYDVEGNLLGVRPNTDATRQQAENPPEHIQRIIDTATSERSNVELWELRHQDADEFSFAVPLSSDVDNRPLGALLIEINSIQAIRDGVFPLISTSLLFTLIPIGLVILFASSLVGTVYGWLASRGLVKRLKVLTETADTWRHGDFSVKVKDSSKDEIGQLGQRLNLMAEQTQNLLQSRSELAAIEERNRIARDLHDSAKQQIFATTMQIRTAKALFEKNPEAAKKHLEEAEQLAKQVQQELSGLIQELRPAALEGKGLFEAVRETADNFSRQNNIPTSVQIQGERELPLTVEQPIFRVFQETLNNIAKHSQASEVIVRLKATNDELELAVKDNGIGFDVKNDRSGLGLTSMQERMADINGRFQLSSAPNKGTIIKATAPL